LPVHISTDIQAEVGYVRLAGSDRVPGVFGASLVRSSTTPRPG